MRSSMIEELCKLIRDTSSSLPDDVLKALKSAARKETKESSAAVVLKTVLDNCVLAKASGTPLCQDTGTLTFFVDERLRKKVTPEVLKRAVALATERGYLRKNCIDSISGKSYDDNCCEGAPVVHYVDGENEEWRIRNKEFGGKPTVTLLLKGGGSENMSRQYSLPDSVLGAGRDIAGVRKCILDAVQKIQGYGCAPGILGICIGGDRATGYEVAKEQLLRPLDASEAWGSKSEERKVMYALEKRILREANSLGVGPMGLGGRTTLLGVKIASRPRVPASFFVSIAYMCWACRRRTMCV